MGEGDGWRWVPVLNQAEVINNFPTNLFARIAYQESSFRPSVITGAVCSSAGALGLMQLIPKFFASVRVPVPFTEADTVAQILDGAALLKSLYARFHDWQEAVAAYNWGGGNEHHAYVTHGGYRLVDMPNQTQKYVKEVFHDVPIQGALLS